MIQPLHCHSIGCKVSIGSNLLFCRKHWATVDNSLKFQINKFRTAEGFPDYDEAFRALLLMAILHVAEAEADDDYELNRAAAEMVAGR